MFVKQTPIQVLEWATLYRHMGLRHRVSFDVCTHPLCIAAREAIVNLSAVVASRDVEPTSMTRSLADIADTGVAWCTEAEFAALITKVKALEAGRCGHTLDGSPCLMEADHPGSHCEVPGMMLVAVQAKLKAREISLKVAGTCEVCWTNSWEPTLNEEECLAEHPHPEMDCIRCGQCSLFTTYKALTEALADAETENERLRELIDCNNEWRDA